MTTKRTYEASHPWLTFALNLSHLDHKAWIALGAAAAKCDHIAHAMLAPEVAQSVHQLYLAKGALATTAIEGNTLSEEEVTGLLAGTLKLPPSREYLGQEIENIVHACNALTADVAASGPKPITAAIIKEMNRAVLNGLEVEDHVAPGEIRTTEVNVGRYKCPPHRDCVFLLDRLCDVLNEFPLAADNPIAYAILKATFAHLYLAWIHPFGDGNGRTARLLEFYILIGASLPQPACHLLSNHYNQTRSEYYRQLDRARQTDDGVVRFISYAIGGLTDGLSEQIDLIREHQWDVAWSNHIYETFRTASGSAASRRRQRTLALSLSCAKTQVRIADIPTLDADLGRAYANVTPRTLHRDIDALVRLELVVYEDRKVRAHRERLLAFSQPLKPAVPAASPPSQNRPLGCRA